MHLNVREPIRLSLIIDVENFECQTEREEKITYSSTHKAITDMIH